MVQIHLVIPKSRIVIAGHPNSGWSAADANDPNAFKLDFQFRITDDGNGNYLLVYQSLDNKYAADSWHETIDEAVACALETFGIARTEWSSPAKKK